MSRTKTELVTISEAARRLGVTRPTVYSRLATGILKGRRVAGYTFVVWEKEAESAVHPCQCPR